jgi:hypothetical protein
MARYEITYEPTDELPAPDRTGSSNGDRRTSYAPLVAACREQPGQWFMSPAPTLKAAYSRAATLRKYGLIAHARGTEVYVCADADS